MKIGAPTSVHNRPKLTTSALSGRTVRDLWAVKNIEMLMKFIESTKIYNKFGKSANLILEGHPPYFLEGGEFRGGGEAEGSNRKL